ncbi:hypothetical protein IHV25_04605 [Phaeovibrio sulfidiphilus]|uniref:PEP-CTERM protein-sorting domain-containing protein n=1 Tax=Phaeovibrio sulfidiphilus TaxID=1220600 RepID=A0A8J6YWF2_9PROT|nr:hypothetical protein [Phaeovibrio sulfidiphilus]MBE1236927.1 hypothetical protein [Phaeovibrio sulfidiphilus]
MNGFVTTIRARFVVPLLFLAVALGATLAPSSSRAAEDTYVYRFETVNMYHSYGLIAGALYVGHKYERYGGGEWWSSTSELRFNFVEHDDWSMRWPSMSLPSPYRYPDWDNKQNIRLEIPFTLHKAMGLEFGASNPTGARGKDLYMDLPGNGLTFTLQGPGVNWTGVLDGKAGMGDLSAVWAYLESGDYVLSLSGTIGGFLDGSLDGLDFRGQYAGFSVTFSDVPLPGALVLLGTALAGAGAVARRRHRVRPGTGAAHPADPGQGRI